MVFSAIIIIFVQVRISRFKSIPAQPSVKPAPEKKKSVEKFIVCIVSVIIIYSLRPAGFGRPEITRFFLTSIQSWAMSLLPMAFIYNYPNLKQYVKKIFSFGSKGN